MTYLLKIRLTIIAIALSAFSIGEVSFAKDNCCIALVGGTVISATGQAPLENAVVLIRDDKIERIGKASAIKIPSNYKKIDVSGKWLTPGLIDTNLHLILTTVPEFFIKYEDQLEEIALQSAQVALKYGLTTVADTWGPLEPLLAVRNKINKGEVVGSRLLVAGNIVGTGGPFTAYFMGGWPAGGKSIRYGGWVHPSIQNRINALWEAGVGPNMAAMTPKEAADTLRAYIARGVDMVKIGVSGHGLGAVEPLVFSDDALKAMREVAREEGVPFTTHTFSVPSLRQALKVEPDLLIHPNVMSVGWNSASEPQKEAIREMIDEIRKKNIYAGLMMIPNWEHTSKTMAWDSSKTPQEYYLNMVMDERRPYASKENYDKQVAALRVWLDRNVKVTLSTDAGPEAEDLGPTVWGRLGRFHFERLEGLQSAGMKPMEVLMAATKNGAEAYNLSDETGTLEEGKLADILVLDANPLVDIANLRKINQIYKAGIKVDRSILPQNPILKYDPEAPWPY